MKVYTIWNHKGGTGKTSITSLLSIYLSETSRKILLIDIDSQESLTEGFLPEREEGKNSVYEWYMGKAKTKECIHPINENLSIIPGNIWISKIQNSINQNFFSRELKKLPYDYCFIDCPPTWNNSIVSAMVSSDTVLIPSLNSVYDLKSTKFTLSEIRDVSEKLESIVIFNRMKSLSKLEKELRDPLYGNSKILSFPSYTSVNNSIKTRKIKGNLLEALKELFGKIEGVL